MERFWGRLGEVSAWVAGAFLDFCLPGRCAGCLTASPAPPSRCWCDECFNSIPRLGSPLCPLCGRPYPHASALPDHLCEECSGGRFAFDSARSVAKHEGVVRDGVHQLKFGGSLQWVPPLVELLAVALENSPGQNADLILPVPLHVKRIRQRGFNQAGLLAGRLARRTGLPVRYGVLVRELWSRPQTRLDRKTRLENVAKAFRVAVPNAVLGREILLIDDVFTTGSTLHECARALKKAGAAGVHALTVSRSVPE